MPRNGKPLSAEPSRKDPSIRVLRVSSAQCSVQSVSRGHNARHQLYGRQQSQQQEGSRQGKQCQEQCKQNGSNNAYEWKEQQWRESAKGGAYRKDLRKILFRSTTFEAHIGHTHDKQPEQLKMLFRKQSKVSIYALCCPTQIAYIIHFNSFRIRQILASLRLGLSLMNARSEEVSQATLGSVCKLSDRSTLD